MRSATRLIILSLLITAGNNCFLQAQAQEIRADLIWKTPRVFQTPESVLYDAGYDVMYVSNINGDPAARDGNGFISRLSVHGDVEVLKWIRGLNAPKGMGKIGDVLYVSDIDVLVEIDIPSQKILNRHAADDAVFLNDITTDRNGNVYISDSQSNKIYRFDGMNMELYFDDPVLDHFNGLFCRDNLLYVGCKDKILKINLIDRGYKEVMHGLGTIDGLNVDGTGNFIVSDWRGKVQYVVPPDTRILLFDTSAESIRAADIWFETALQMLYVPTFSDGRVMAYKISRD